MGRARATDRAGDLTTFAGKRLPLGREKRALAAGQERVRQFAGPPILHASVRAAQQPAREDEIEAARRAAPDPRGVLRAAIGLRSETQAEVDRVAPLLSRARLLVEDLERRQHQHAEAIAAERSLPLGVVIESAAVCKY